MIEERLPLSELLEKGRRGRFPASVVGITARHSEASFPRTTLYRTGATTACFQACISRMVQKSLARPRSARYA